MSELTRLTIADARAGLKQKKFSAAELADAHLAAIEKARSLLSYTPAYEPEAAVLDGIRWLIDHDRLKVANRLIV